MENKLLKPQTAQYKKVYSRKKGVKNKFYCSKTTNTFWKRWKKSRKRARKSNNNNNKYIYSYGEKKATQTNNLMWMQLKRLKYQVKWVTTISQFDMHIQKRYRIYLSKYCILSALALLHTAYIRTNSQMAFANFWCRSNKRKIPVLMGKFLCLAATAFRRVSNEPIDLLLVQHVQPIQMEIESRAPYVHSSVRNV